MGLTAENVQVYVRGNFPASVRRRVEDAVRNYLQARGFEEVDSEEQADRTITIGPAEDQRWIAVYDSQTGSAEEVAKVISREADSPAVSLMVFDSDDVFAGLVEGGKVRDRFEKSEGKKRKGRAERWAAYADPARLRDVFGEDPLFAEEQLGRLAEALGMNREWCLTPAGEAGGEDFLHLHFRSRSSGGRPREKSGPPAFSTPPHTYPPFELGVGEALWQSLTAYVNNHGGPAKGVRIEIGGSAVEEGLVEVSGLRVFQAARRVQHDFPLAPGERAVDLPEMLLEAGMEQPASGNMLQLLAQLRRARKNATQRADTVSASVSGTAKAAGQGDLALKFIPMENPVRGAGTRAFSLIIRPRGRMPLRVDPAVPGASTRARVLEIPRFVNGVVSLRSGPEARRVALATIEQWVSFLTPLRPERWNLMLASNALAAPREHASKTSNLLLDKVWTQVQRQFEGCAYCSGHMGEDRLEGNESYAGCAGFGFDPSAVTAGILRATFSPHLGFWLDTKAFPEEEVAGAEARLAEIYDQLMSDGHLLQAFLTRWNCGDLSMVQSTAYEFACGVSGQCTTTEAWCSKHLRGVGDRIWLGKELIARLGNLETLLAAAAAEPLGEGLRVTRRPEATLDDLERALDPLLAGVQEWQQGMRDLYQAVTGPRSS